MRSAILAGLSASAILAMVSVGYAQNNPSSSVPSIATTKNTTAHQDYDYTVRREKNIPYRPCSANVVTASGRHECL